MCSYDCYDGDVQGYASAIWIEMLLMYARRPDPRLGSMGGMSSHPLLRLFALYFDLA